MTGGKIYLVWTQPYDDGAQDIEIFTDKWEAEQRVQKGTEYMRREHIPAGEMRTEAFIMFPTNEMPFDQDELDCNY